MQFLGGRRHQYRRRQGATQCHPDHRRRHGRPADQHRPQLPARSERQAAAGRDAGARRRRGTDDRGPRGRRPGLRRRFGQYRHQPGHRGDHQPRSYRHQRRQRSRPADHRRVGGGTGAAYRHRYHCQRHRCHPRGLCQPRQPAPVPGAGRDGGYPLPRRLPGRLRGGSGRQRRHGVDCRTTGDLAPERHPRRGQQVFRAPGRGATDQRARAGRTARLPDGIQWRGTGGSWPRGTPAGPVFRGCHAGAVAG